VKSWTKWFGLAVAVLGLSVGMGGRAEAGLVIFANQAAFEAAAPGLTSQDFSAANVPDGDFDVMANPLNGSTNNGIFSPGNIKPGLTITATGNHPGDQDLFIDGVGESGNTRKTVAANFFVESLNLSFAPTSTAVGATLLSEFSASTFTVSVFGPGNTLLGTFTDSNVPNSGAGSFFGVVATGGDTISRINFNSTTNELETVSFVEFGNVAAVPEPTSLASAGVGVLVVFGYAWLRRKRTIA
jgi:hypothetical protein